MGLQVYVCVGYKLCALALATFQPITTTDSHKLRRPHHRPNKYNVLIRSMGLV